ncbi:MAG: carboxypeptidase-like regulatory domain-containing protein [Candidatus Sulfotelmatobacter sp.]
MHTRISKLALAILIFVGLASILPVWGQSTSTGTVAGTVTDSSGAVVASATVTLTDTSTNIARITTTNSAGRYIYVDVTPGIYSVAVSKPGFATTKTEHQEVEVGGSITVNLSLQVGGASVVVEVQGAAIELETMNATIGNTITSAALDALPSIGRDVSTFVELQPGVTPEGSVGGTVNDQSYFSLDGGNNSNDMDGNMSTYTATYAGDPSGGVAAQNTFYLTGNPTGVMPTPQDSVEEFKVNTAGQTADFNSSSGAEVKVVTKRGTNAWHGTGYEYYLDNNWSSNSWQNNEPGALHVGLPSFHYSRFGGAIGGPLIPKQILGGKTYVFFNYEAFRWPDNSVTIHRDVPSPNLRNGIIMDPVTGATYNLAAIDPRGIGLDPLVQQIWNKYEPASNASCVNPLCDGTNVLGFNANVTQPESNNFMVGRLDHDFSKNWHFMSSYRYFKFGTNATNDQVDIGGFFSGDKLGVPASQSGDPQEAWFLVGGLTTNISPNVTNDFHYSFLRNWWQWARAGDVPQLPGLGGALEIYSGESNGHTDDLAPYNVNTQQTRTRFWDGHDQMLRDDVSMLKGNHLFLVGGQYQHNFNWHQRTDNGGGINYQPVYQLGNGSGSGLFTDLPICTATSDIPNCGTLTAAALGIASVAQIAYTRSGSNLTLNPPLTPAFDQSTIPYYNTYFSDIWHMKPTFTLTYGLGWTLEMPPVEKNGKQVELVDQNDEPISGPDYLAARKREALLGQVYNPEVGFALVGNTANGLKYPYDPFYGEFSPRIAAAWNPHFDADTPMGKIFGREDTVVRGGYGRVYGRLNGVDLVLVPLLGTGLIQPVQNFAQQTTTGSCPPGPNTLACNAFRIGVDGLTASLGPPPSQTLVQPDYPGFNAIAAGAGESLDPHFRPNVVDSFDLTIQRQVSRKLTLEFGYIGRRITHEYQPLNINAVPYMMTVGGQQFAQAYKNVVLQYCGSTAGMAGGGCNGNGAGQPNPGAVTAQPFFETALKGTGYCTGFASCTAAVVSNEGTNLASQLVWTLWSDLDSGVGCPTGGCSSAGGGADAFNFPRTMMNTPIPASESPIFGANGQLSSGVAVNSSIGHGNYNAGFASVKMADWRGLTMQSNFTWSKALGTGALVQATSGFTADDPYNLNEMYGPQLFNRKFVFNTFLVYTPPFYKGQSGLMGRVLGGWTFAPIVTAGSGQPLQIWPSNFTTQSFGEGDSNDNYLSLETAVPLGSLPSHGHAYYNVPSGGLPVNIFQNPAAAVADYRNPILGLDSRDTSYLTGLPYWNLDFSIRKNIRVAETVALEFQANFINILNHDQWLDPGQPWGLFSPGTFGALFGSAQETPGGNRTIQVAARVRF